MRLLFLAGLVLIACASKEPRPSAEQLALGERAYQKCYSCHSLEPGESLSGPPLSGIIGRAVAAEPDFDYSPAMQRFAEREPCWTRDLLERFAADPEALVPGTSMNFHGMYDPDERAALIAYLERR